MHSSRQPPRFNNASMSAGPARYKARMAFRQAQGEAMRQQSQQPQEVARMAEMQNSAQGAISQMDRMRNLTAPAKMSSGGETCRGTGAATRGGKFSFR